MERAHQTLKTQIQKLKEGEFKYSSPHHLLQHALFVINILNTDSAGIIAILLHWCPEQLNTKPLVKWKDFLSRQWQGPDPLFFLAINPQQPLNKSPKFILKLFYSHFILIQSCYS